MKTIEEIIEDNPNMRLWEDNKTIDIELPESESTFTKDIIPCKCPACGESVVKGNQEILRGIPKTIKGAQLTCKNCKLNMFIHQPLKN